MKQEIKDNKILIHSPFHPSAPRRFRNAGGKWNGENWEFPITDQEIVNQACIDIYGVSGIEETAKAKITTKQSIKVLNGSVIFVGFALAIARGRDSGAKTGDDVKLVSGNINSSGSVKNWSSWVSENAVFIIDEFPIGIHDNEDFHVEYLEDIKLSNPLSKFSDDELLAEIAKRGLSH